MTERERSTFECFGLVIHGISADESIARIDDALHHGAQVFVVTANPEILLEARRNPAYWQVLRRAELRLVDSFGLKLAGLVSGARPTRVPGVDFAERLLSEAARRGRKVALIGGKEGVADKAAWEIRKRLPGLSVMAEQSGVVTPDGVDDDAGAETRTKLVQYAPDILFVAFGHPKQESWIARHLAEFPSVKIAMGVGGAFDYWAGSVRRAPSIFRTLGLEWLWRLLIKPERWKRIFNATVLFPIVFLLSKISKKS